MRHFFVVLLIVAATVLGPMQPAWAAEQKLNDTDKKFLQAAAEINMAEVQLGKIAEDNAASPVIKKFGMRTLADHSAMNKELRELARKNGLTLPEKLDAKHQDMIAQLATFKGTAFDQAYSRDMVSGHEKAIQMFEAQITAGKNPDVKVLALKWLPTLREHLALARKAVKEVQGER